MRTAIIYYSRTGTTRRMADALAAELDADIGEIQCPRYRRGPVRYLLAGYNSVKGNLPSIKDPAINPSSYDLVLIGTPVWTSHPSLPVRAYLAAKPSLPARIGLFVTHGGHSPAETALTELAALLPVPPAETIALQKDKVLSGDVSDRIHAFARSLSSGPLTGS
ncbi:MAG: hypothetical protein NXI27_10400 [Alphaproteobacteria bacterium]|nr:hypothetical protein [Alphaproteobacteria bacterium]